MEARDEQPTTTGSPDGFSVQIRVEELRVNGPVDLLVVSENQTPEPALHEIQRAWQPGEPMTVEWNMTLRGPTDRFDWELYPVVASGDGLACIEEDTGRLIAFEDGDPPEACQSIGGASAAATRLTGTARTLHLVSMALIMLGMIAAFVLGGYVLRHAWRETPGLSLGGYLVLAGVGFGTLAATELFELVRGPSVLNLVRFDEFVIFPSLALLPGALLTFAVGYPSLHPSLRGRRGWPLATLGPSVLLAGYLWVSFVLDDGPDVMPPPRGVPLIGGVVLGALLAAWIFHRRSRDASTDLERRRLRYMGRAVALPFAAGAIAMLVLYLVDILGGMAAYASGLIALVLAVMALGPAAGMAWGLLKYKVVDLETKLRFTVSRGVRRLRVRGDLLRGERGGRDVLHGRDRALRGPRGGGVAGAGDRSARAAGPQGRLRRGRRAGRRGGVREVPQAGGLSGHLRGGHGRRTAQRAGPADAGRDGGQPGPLRGGAQVRRGAGRPGEGKRRA